MSNRLKYPEAWRFFTEHARNVSDEPDLTGMGKYRIPKPDHSGDFIYANDPAELFDKFKAEFYAPRLQSPSVAGKIQYIVNHF